VGFDGSRPDRVTQLLLVFGHAGTTCCQRQRRQHGRYITSMEVTTMSKFASKAKARKDRHHTAKRRQQQRPSPALLDGLDEADQLLSRRKYTQAVELLQELDRRYPRRKDVLAELAYAQYHGKDLASYQRTCERLLAVDPDDAGNTLALASICRANIHPATALKHFRHFLARWPDDARAAEVRQSAAELESILREFYQDEDCEEEDLEELACLHEEVHMHLERGNLAAVRDAATRLLLRWPRFAPALNNLGEALWLEGRVAQAIATARRVLEIESDNIHALANLSRYLWIDGQDEEALALAAQLKRLQTDHADYEIKLAETLSFLGDDQGVIDAFDRAQMKAKEWKRSAPALLYHLAAAAKLRLGREVEARKLWRQAQKLAPHLDVARENLADLSNPPGERHAPWALPMNRWVPKSHLEQLISMCGRRRLSDKDMRRKVRAFLEDKPYFVSLVPRLLERGDGAARKFAYLLATMVRTPEMLAALKVFAQSQHGPDPMRLEASQFFSRHSAEPAGAQRMWIQGEWRDIIANAFDIHNDVDEAHAHSPEVEQLAIDALEALKANDGERAEGILKQALRLEPDARDLLNNLATAYCIAGKDDEARAIIRQQHERDPDYLFARVNLAHLHLQDGKLDQARALVLPLLSRRRLHLTEFVAMAQVHMAILVKDGELDGALQWLKMWEDVAPDDAQLGHWRYLLRDGPKAKLLHALKKLAEWGNKKRRKL
jgi:Flp pilus assembly protein TadD